MAPICPVAALLVRAKLAVLEMPLTPAVTVKLPGVAFAVKTGDVATPELLVVAVGTPPANVPEAPLAGALNATVTPAIPLPFDVVTVATNRFAKAVLTVALCGVPPVACMEDGIGD